VTAPLKTSVGAHCACRDDIGSAVGAINTLRRDAAGWSGRNFDVAGFLAPLDDLDAARPGDRAVVIGAGGAARAVAWALEARGVSVAISARHAARASSLAAVLGVKTTPYPPSAGWDLLVNATPVGSMPASERLDVSVEGRPGRIVYDLVYNPPDTSLLAAARGAGARVVGGLDMLVEQAGLQSEWWTGRPAPRSVMRTAAEAFLGAKDDEANHV
jgi:shikimate dehydrogenase